MTELPRLAVSFRRRTGTCPGNEEHGQEDAEDRGSFGLGLGENAT